MKSISLCVIIIAFGLCGAVWAQETAGLKVARCIVATDDFEETELDRLSGSELQYIADSIRLNDETLILVGDVTVRDAVRTIRSDYVTYDRKKKIIDAPGHVSVIQSDSRFSGKKFKINRNRNAISGSSVRFLLYSSNKTDNGGRTTAIRGDAEHLDLEDGIWDLAQSSVTHCPEGVEDVAIDASEVELNTRSRQGKARNVTLKIRNIPVFYSPFIGFPLGEERMSGFLFPTLGYRSKHGTIIEVPYYFNLAPNYDVSVSTNILSKRGLQMQGEFRHLGVYSDTHLRSEFLSGDKRHPIRENRYAAHLQANWFDGGNLYSRLDTQWVSDRTYKEEFSGFFGEDDNEYLRQDAEAGVFGDGFKFSVGSDRYIIAENLADDEERTHERFPWASYEQLYPFGGGLRLVLGMYVDRFRHPTELSATRYRTDTAIQYQYAPHFGMMKIRIGGERIGYRKLTNVDQQAGLPESRTLSSEYFEADGRLYFDRFFDSGENRRIWTIEPRVKFVSAPKKNQADFPVFDTTARQLDEYEDLFESKPYVGGDRLRDVRQISAGVSVSLNGPAGYPSIRKFGFGRIFYSQNQVRNPDDRIGQVSLSGTDKSDIFLGASFYEPQWQVDYGTLYDDKTERFDQASFRLTHKYGENSRFGTVYRYKRDDNEQIGAVLDKSMESGWRVKLMLIESLKTHQMAKSEINLGYASCCLNVGFRATRALDDQNKLDNSFKIFIRIDGFGIN